MGFNHLQPSSGPFLLGPGESMGITMWHGGGGRGQQGGDDHGAQWIMADPVDINVNVPDSFPSTLQVNDFTKIRDLWVDVDPASGLITFDLGRTVVSYGVTVTNPGPSAIFFTIQGGGNS